MNRVSRPITGILIVPSTREIKKIWFLTWRELCLNLGYTSVIMGTVMPCGDTLRINRDMMMKAGPRFWFRTGGGLVVTGNAVILGRDRTRANERAPLRMDGPSMTIERAWEIVRFLGERRR